jgi:hypothetical protein
MLLIEDVPMPLQGGTHINAAPDVAERLRHSTHCGGEAVDGTPLLHGMPVYSTTFYPPRYWQLWQG